MASDGVPTTRLELRAGQPRNDLDASDSAATALIHGVAVFVHQDGGAEPAADLVRGAIDAAPRTVDDLLAVVQRANERLRARGRSEAGGGSDATVHEDDPTASVVLVALVRPDEASDPALAVLRVGDPAVYAVGADGRDADVVSERFEQRTGRAVPRVLPHAEVVRARRLGQAAKAIGDVALYEARAGDRFVVCARARCDGLTADVVRETLVGVGDVDEADRVLRARVGAGDGDGEVLVAEVRPRAGATGETAGRGRPGLVAVIPGAARVLDEVTTLRAVPRVEPDDRAAGGAGEATALTGSIGFGKPALIFVVLAIVSLLGTYFVLGRAAPATYYVGLDGDVVAIFTGAPDGHHEVFERSTVSRLDLPLAKIPPLDAGVRQPSIEAARTYVDGLKPAPKVPPGVDVPITNPPPTDGGATTVPTTMAPNQPL